MLKVLLILISIFGGFNINMQTINLNDEPKFENVCSCFEKATSIHIFDDGIETTYQKGDEKYQIILEALKNITNGSRPMPAFAVSLDEDTRLARKKGFWVELEFESEMKVMELSFKSLLIEVKKDYTGLNIIRKYDEKYQGRCFYLDLDCDMSKLYQAVLNISKNK